MFDHFSNVQVRVTLRSVLNEEDEELEILPHVKMSKDFEIYEPIVLRPPIQILPWDDNVKPTYNVAFKVCSSPAQCKIML